MTHSKLLRLEKRRIVLDLHMLNPQGDIQNQTSFSKIDPVFEPLIAQTVQALKTQFQTKLHSVYLYGSIAEGRARPGLSDADFVVVLKQAEANAEDLLEQLSHDLYQRFSTLVCKVDLPFGTLAEILAPEQLYGWGAYLKILCLPLYGEDLRRHFPHFRPCLELTRGWNGDLAQETDKALQALQADDANGNTIQRGMSARILRSFFMLMAADKQVWSSDLKVQTAHVLKHYPEKAERFQFFAQARRRAVPRLTFLAELKAFQRDLLPLFEARLGR